MSSDAKTKSIDSILLILVTLVAFSIEMRCEPGRIMIHEIIRHLQNEAADLDVKYLSIEHLQELKKVS